MHASTQRVIDIARRGKELGIARGSYRDCVSEAVTRLKSPPVYSKITSSNFQEAPGNLSEGGSKLYEAPTFLDETPASFVVMELALKRHRASRATRHSAQFAK